MKDSVFLNARLQNHMCFIAAYWFFQLGEEDVRDKQQL